jgi:hypothetical protein
MPARAGTASESCFETALTSYGWLHASSPAAGLPGRLDDRREALHPIRVIRKRSRLFCEVAGGQEYAGARDELRFVRVDEDELAYVPKRAGVEHATQHDRQASRSDGAVR